MPQVVLSLRFHSIDDARRHFGRFANLDSFLVPSAEAASEGSLVEVALELPPPLDTVALRARVTAVVHTPSTVAMPYRLQVSPVDFDPDQKARVRAALTADAPAPVASGGAVQLSADDLAYVNAPTPVPPPSDPPLVLVTPVPAVPAPVAPPAPPRPVDVEELLRPLPRATVVLAAVPTRQDEPEDAEAAPRERTPAEIAPLMAEYVRHLSRSLVTTSLYDAGHSSTVTARYGVYDSFRSLIADSREVTLLDQSNELRPMLLVYGVVDEPTDMARLLPPGQSELLVPKLAGYFSARGIVALSWKQALDGPEFDRFLDLMAGSQIPRGDGHAFAAALAENRVENVSIVCADTLPTPRKLSWRVEVALTRLRTDLTVLPMFKGRTAAELHRVRAEVFRDVVRPLRHPALLRELLLHCDVVAEHLRDLGVEEVEQLMVQSISLTFLADVVSGFAQDVSQVLGAQATEADEVRAAQLLRLTRLLARKLARDSRPAHDAVLRKLTALHVLRLDELPPPLQDKVRLAQKADLLMAGWRRHLHVFDSVTSADDHERFLQTFAALLPELLTRADLDPAVMLVSQVVQHSADVGPFAGRQERAARWMADLSAGAGGEELARQMVAGDRLRRAGLLRLCRTLGDAGVPVLFRALGDSPARIVRQEVVETLESMRHETRTFLGKELGRPGVAWYYRRNLLDLLGRVGSPKDLALAREFVRDEHPRVRLQAFLSACQLDPAGIEHALLDGLHDPDVDIRAACVKRLGQRRSVAPAFLQHLRALLLNAQEEASAREACALLAGYGDPAVRGQAAALLLDLLDESPKKGLLARLSTGSAVPEVLRIDACHALARLQAAEAIPVLTRLAEDRNRAVKAAAARALRQMPTPPAEPAS